MREKAVTCFSSAAEHMSAPPEYFTSAAFRDLRWTMAGDQRDERMRTFCRKLLARLDGLKMPFYPAVGLMNLPTARHRYVTGLDPYSPSESPFLDGSAVVLKHCIHGADMPKRCWVLLAEIGFDVARLAQIPIIWGGLNAGNYSPGHFQTYDGFQPENWIVDGRTYGVRRSRSDIDIVD